MPGHHLPDKAAIDRLIARMGGGPGMGSLESGTAPLSQADRLEASERALRKRLERHPGTRHDEAVRRLMHDARNGFARLATEGRLARLSASEFFALEAVVETDGSRPALFVQDGTISLADDELSGPGSLWVGPAAYFLPDIENVIASVGAVKKAGEDWVYGTAFMIAPEIAVTNRHVLEGIAALHDNTWVFHSPVDIDFRHEYDRPGQQVFRVAEAIFAGEGPIFGAVNFANLDLALLRLEGDGDFPAPLKCAATPALQGNAIQVIGFPSSVKIQADTEDPPIAPLPRHEYQSVVADLFPDALGFKRWSPGRLLHLPGSLPGDDKQWVIAHDASTLGGNSGSAIVDFSTDGGCVLASHFGGVSRILNYGLMFDRFRDVLQQQVPLPAPNSA